MIFSATIDEGVDKLNPRLLRVKSEFCENLLRPTGDPACFGN